MGQFLAIGIVSRISLAKNQVNKAQISIEQLQEKMQKECYFLPELYEMNETENFYYFDLKEVILYEQLVPFLKILYPLIYDDSAYYESILKELESLPPSEWLVWAKTKPEEDFQFDKYGECDYLRHGFSGINVYYESLLLSMEGKISMECYGRQFRFFKYAMVQAFKEFALAGALRVYISG